MNIQLSPLGLIHSPYQEKFSVPRQPGLVSATTSSLVFNSNFNDPDLLDNVEQFSHFWLVFAFHQNIKSGWKAKVRPPRLGGNKKVGVLASRSSFRPNHLGLSLLELSHVERSPNKLAMYFKGGDLVNGTPIYDVKPYLPYADSIPDAQAGYAQQAPQQQLLVIWTEQALQQAQQLNIEQTHRLVIEQVLAQDPRPAYKQNKTDDREYGVALYQFNIRWRILEVNASESQVEIVSVTHAA
ncbi:tRNA (N6-threonylcarbamoyladenosine(37)-N6)-methyltransferase TrmO [Agarivorans litoreus]|uniref:tRNA (N6-threonylcarbamoyladenosine(37)-N6)-methyltransferase TrmO n=1 Tax=Agarivorans litoreus TaxID=1510455 RepID=UPI001C7CF411|nr:tRNA (N6-threonylcarbamoyladenosine(37)-N6)-methyltransferase TrmO [Agarivorans litoreus]